MSKEKKTYETEQLREFANRLRIVAARLDQGIDSLEGTKITVLDVAAWKSGELGVKNPRENKQKP